MKRLISIIGIGSVVFTMMVSTHNAAAQNSDQITVTLSDPSRPGLLKINMLNGAITVRTHAGPDITIEGRSVGRTRPPVNAEGLRRIDTANTGLTVVEQNNVITVSGRAFLDSSNLEIQVPVKTNLNLSTINGNAISVDGVEGDVEVSNMNGQVRLNNVSGSVVAHAGNGNLFAVFRELSGNKPMSFTSMNGNVDVTLPASAKANLRIRSDNGDAWTDFDLQERAAAAPQVEDSRTRGGRFRIVTDRTVTATINGGGTDLDLRTLHGNIFIRKAK